MSSCSWTARRTKRCSTTFGADNFEGNYGTAPGAPGTPSQTTFKELYSSKLGGEPSSLFISEAFDAAAILALAIAEAGSEDGDDIKAAIRTVANAPGEKVGPGDLATRACNSSAKAKTSTMWVLRASRRWTKTATS